jgi:hypothetical protein
MKRESAVAANKTQPPNTPPAIAPAGGLEAPDKAAAGVAVGVKAGLTTREDAGPLLVAMDVKVVGTEYGAPDEKEGTLSARDENATVAVLDVEAIFGSWLTVISVGGEEMVVSANATLCEVTATAGAVIKDGAVLVTTMRVVLSLSGERISVLVDVAESVVALRNVLSSVLRTREKVREGVVLVVVDAVDVVEEVSAEDSEELVDVSEVNELEEIEVDELVEVKEVDELRDVVLERDLEVEEVLLVDDLSEEVNDWELESFRSSRALLWLKQPKGNVDQHTNPMPT